ncbi:four helix bundle protein [Belliella pelovolcani]
MGNIQRFEDLEIWQKAIDIAVEVYHLADKGLLATDFKSRGQFIDAAISISNNIAEGFEYNSNRSFINFLRYAKGSAGEVRSQAFVLVRAGRISESEYQSLYIKLESISKEIKGFMKYLQDYENQKKSKR